MTRSMTGSEWSPEPGYAVAVYTFEDTASDVDVTVTKHACANGANVFQLRTRSGASECIRLHYIDLALQDSVELMKIRGRHCWITELVQDEAQRYLVWAYGVGITESANPTPMTLCVFDSATKKQYRFTDDLYPDSNIVLFFDEVRQDVVWLGIHHGTREESDEEVSDDEQEEPPLYFVQLRLPLSEAAPTPIFKTTRLENVYAKTIYAGATQYLSGRQFLYQHALGINVYDWRTLKDGPVERYVHHDYPERKLMLVHRAPNCLCLHACPTASPHPEELLQSWEVEPPPSSSSAIVLPPRDMILEYGMLYQVDHRGQVQSVFPGEDVRLIEVGNDRLWYVGRNEQHQIEIYTTSLSEPLSPSPCEPAAIFGWPLRS